MGLVKEWSSIICISALLGSIFEIVTPSGRMEKMVRFVFGAFMVCAILLPISQTFKNMSLKVDFNKESAATSASVDNKMQEQFNNLVSEKIKRIAAEALDKEGIKYKKMDVIMDMDENSSISIIKISLVLDKKEAIKSDVARGIIKEKLGLETDISF